jgi:hypothetical protein
MVKAILAGREHVPKAPERRALRLRKLREARTQPRKRPKRSR